MYLEGKKQMAQRQETLVLACSTNISEILAFCLIALILFCSTEKNPIKVLDKKFNAKSQKDFVLFFCHSQKSKATCEGK